MKRRPDWQLRLSNFARERVDMPFAWGVNDCCLFAADAVLAMTDIDPAADLRGYLSAPEALRIVEARGGFEAIASAALGAPIDALRASVGDVVMVENAGRPLLAICNGTVALAPGAEGSVVLDMQAAVAAWRV